MPRNNVRASNRCSAIGKVSFRRCPMHVVSRSYRALPAIIPMKMIRADQPIILRGTASGAPQPPRPRDGRNLAAVPSGRAVRRRRGGQPAMQFQGRQVVRCSNPSSAWDWTDGSESWLIARASRIARTARRHAMIAFLRRTARQQRSSGSWVTVHTQPGADRQGRQAECSHKQKGLAASPDIDQPRREGQQRDRQPNA